MSYTLTIFGSVIRDEDQASIPNDPRNRDWQEYQAWLAEGNAPKPIPNPIFQPSRVPMWTVKTVLQQQGLLAQVDALVSASQDIALQNVWQYGAFVDKDSPAISAIAAQLELTEAQVEALFIQANSLQV